MLIHVVLAAALGTTLPAWEFEIAAAGRAWVANHHLTDVRVRNGVLEGRAVGWDPILVCTGLDFRATPWQYVVIRLKADQPGIGELFWTGQTAGRYGGFTARKKTSFQVHGGDRWQEVVVFPFWQGEGTVRKLRLDMYLGARFAVDSIRVRTWADAAAQPVTTTAWTWSGDANPWRVRPGGDDYFAPPLRVLVQGFNWLGLRIKSPREGVGSIVWARHGDRGGHAREFVVQPDPKARHYNVPMADNAAWSGTLSTLGVRLPAGARLEAVKLAQHPVGPARLELVRFGLAEGINRPGKPARLCLDAKNVGGTESPATPVRLTLPVALRPTSSSQQQTLPAVPVGGRATVAWSVIADRPGLFTARVIFDKKHRAQTTVRIAPPVHVQRAAYVPKPRPVATDLEVCAYYFPGWNTAAKWTPIRTTAPGRKPVLGWYDEGNPECVDWQIKWAVENGIGTFLVDWYWADGRQQLTHWFEAYRRARHRDMLKVAIMWANHNRPGTHSPADWERVTREWIDRYFNLPGYYRIDGKPAVFIWDPRRIREDLASRLVQRGRLSPGGSQDGAPALLPASAAVHRLFDHSEIMAQAAGYEGITFVALLPHASAVRSRVLAAEGYAAITSYHEWGRARELGPSPRRSRFADVVATAPASWRQWTTAAGSLNYFPVVDTGWDARPWHGAKARVIAGRTPALFEQLLRQAKSFARKQGARRIILGPVNEWGEGSYIEPCAEFGFDMLERVRAVFATRGSASWPVNIGPSDAGLGPYDMVSR